MALIYRGVIIKNHKHEVTLPIKQFEEHKVEVLTWCHENFGNRDDSGLWDFWAWDARGAYFTFLKETDAMAFRLRWI